MSPANAPDADAGVLPTLSLTGDRPLFFAQILRWKLKAFRNFNATLERHVLVHFALFSGLVTTLVVGGTFMFKAMFGFLLEQDIIGAPVVDRLVSMILLVFFMMLVFSNLIITLSTTYISKEIDYFMSQPVPHRDVFAFKLVETIFYSSWAFAILSLPLFLGYGWAKHLPLGFYAGVALLIPPFLLIPGAAGAIATMLFAALIPAKRSRAFMVAALVIGMAVMMIAARSAGLSQMIQTRDFTDFKQTLKLLEVGSVQFSPNTWIAEGTFAASRGDWSGLFYWMAVLLSTGLFLLQLCLWLVKPLYYRGWCLARGSSSGARINPKRSLFNKLDYAYAWLGRPAKALVGKDLRTFWRDPSQWSQLVILIGLLFIYVANIRHAARSEGVGQFRENWRVFISFLNMGATCFILSILSTRFFYPMLSLEGRQYWIIGLAPIKRSALLWQKYFFCQACALSITVPLMSFSNYVLKAPPLLFQRSVLTLVLLSFGLTSLAIGLGALTPNFREDNPAKIANGVGGTMNIVLSLLYIVTILTIVSITTFSDLGAGGQWLRQFIDEWRVPIVATYGMIHAVTIVTPLFFGVRQWNRMEF